MPRPESTGKRDDALFSYRFNTQLLAESPGAAVIHALLEPMR